MFFELQNKNERDVYIKLLSAIGSLSELFSENNSIPYMYYRLMENIFCKAFNANNLSRSDISADASKGNFGIGLKTFLHGNGNTFQKVAEFNKDLCDFTNLKIDEKIIKIAMLRNERIEVTKRISGVSDMIYHLLTRSENKMSIYEENMDLINLNYIRIIKYDTKNIHFIDGLHMYKFNVSKSTLFKMFKTYNPLYTFDIKILQDPYEFLLNLNLNRYTIDYNNVFFNNSIINTKPSEDFIVLPLYSPINNEVMPKSGLNQWNANGRIRHPDEVYIPIPSWIHKLHEDFFPYNTNDFKSESFHVLLPNKKILKMKVAQENGKALMSDPNKDLGEWILRDILDLKEYEILTKNKLDLLGIDSVKLRKINSHYYELDFLESGSFEKFQEEREV